MGITVKFMCFIIAMSFLLQEYPYLNLYQIVIGLDIVVEVRQSKIYNTYFEFYSLNFEINRSCVLNIIESLFLCEIA